MTDMFATYGQEAAPDRRESRAPKVVKEPSALEKKMLERQRLNKSYRLSVSKERLETLQVEPRLMDFLRYLRTVKPDDGDELIDQIRSSWLPKSVQPVRIFALRLVARHCDRLNRQVGREALDDPIPPETSVYFEARTLLHAGGRA